MKDYFFESFDKTEIHYYEWKPKEKAKGIVQIIHGLQEHGLRYKAFAEFLAKQGFIVLASDQRLHGITAGSQIGATTIKDVFPIMVKDQMLLADMLIKKYNLPLVIFGHSYGSFITQSLIENYHKHVGVILSGSAYMKRADTLAGKVLTETFANLKGGENFTPEVENFIIDLFNKPFKGEGSWISANEENLKQIAKDPLCGNPLCANFYASMFRNVRLLYSQSKINKIDKNIPIFIASGKDDPVGKMGESTKKLYECYTKNNINTTLKLYENMRHEIINEKNKELVYQDLLEFIKNCTNPTH